MSFKSNYNFITKIASFPCAQPSPLIIAASFLPAVAPALIDFAGFGCRDILKFRLGRGTMCGRGISAQVGKAIPPKLSGLANGLLEFERGFSKAGNWFMIADLAGDTVARWTSMAYTASQCADILQGVSWTCEFSAPQFLLPGVPTIIGGVLRNISAPGPGPWPSGALVPNDWYIQINWKLRAKQFRGSEDVPISTWMRQTFPGGFDFPAVVGRPGYPWQDYRNNNLFDHQNTGFGGTVQYDYFAMSQEAALTTEFHADCQVTPFEPLGSMLKPLDCWRTLAKGTQENPAGRNTGGTNPIIPGFRQAALNPKPRRGPPGGKPRSKN